MNSLYPDPWNFSNTDKNMTSPDGKFRTAFYELSEIAMGAPLKGICYLITGNRKNSVSDMAGGPIVWNESSNRFAIPVWTKNRRQQLGIIDINSQTLTLFSKEFSVLHLKKFKNNKVSGIDSPLHNCTTFDFDISIEQILYVKQLFFR